MKFIKDQRSLSYVHLLRKHQGLNLLCLFLLLTYSFLNIIYPYLIQKLIDKGIGLNSYNIIFQYSILFFVLIGLSIIIGYVMKIKFLDLGQKIILDIKRKILKCFSGYTLEFFNRNKTGDIISILENDVKNVQSLYSYILNDFLSNIIIFIGVAFILIYLDWKLAVITIGFTFILTLIQRKFGKNIRDYSKNLSFLRGSFQSFEQDFFSNYYYIKNINGLEQLEKKFYIEQNNIFQEERKVAKSRALSRQFSTLLQSICVIISLLYGGYNVMLGIYSIGTLFSLIIYVQKLQSPIVSLFDLYIETKRTQASIDRVNSLLCCDDYILNFGNLKLPNEKIDIKISNVYFSYDNHIVLKEFTETITNNSHVGIIGTNGIGKTTLIKLIMRNFNTYEGEILINDINVQAFNDRDFRQNIIALDQKTVIFSATVRENVSLFNKDITDKQIINALKTVNIYDEIKAMPLGINTLLGKNGIILSGGQSQKINLARLFVLDPHVIILDEPTSALDLMSEKLFYKNLFNIFYNKSIIVITHRNEALKYCRRIIDFENIGEMKIGKYYNQQ